jgi:predicted Zn-dependent protease
MPFLSVSMQERTEPRCSDCELGRVPPDLPDAALAQATEREIRIALQSRWRFLASPSATIYLNKLLRQVAKRIQGAAPEPRAMLFEGSVMRTLALPSGTILLSQGTLDELEDEAQLAFVLAHELAHAAAGDAATRLVRLGFRAVAHEDETREGRAWADAAEDLARLGYGRELESQADRVALTATLDLGYDPRSVVHYLQHLETLTARGDDRVGELALCHPSPGDRLRVVESVLAGRVAAKGTGLVNREVFRRAAGRHARTVEPAALNAVGEDRTGAERNGFVAALLGRLPWIGLAAILLLALALMLGWVL